MCFAQTFMQGQAVVANYAGKRVKDTFKLDIKWILYRAELDQTMIPHTIGTTLVKDQRTI